jgi:hypothetical protein
MSKTGTGLRAISHWLPALGPLALAISAIAHSAQPVLQRGYDAGVSGANLTETTLNTSNVGVNSFGAVSTLQVDDNILAQPLYVPNVVIPGQGTHNVVYVATMNDTVYAFDADAGGLALWSVNLANVVGATPVNIANFVFEDNMNIVGHLGILSTPVIDPGTNILYVVACTLENNTMAYRLHAIDITTGNDIGYTAPISGSYGSATFNAPFQLQRVSLVLSDGQVIIGFGPVEEEDDNNYYTGWLMAYDETTLQQTGIFSTEATNVPGAGLWQSGRPPVVDGSGYVYVFSGNGYNNGNGPGYDGVNNFSESALKFDPSNGLAMVDWFTPGIWSVLDEYDLDLSSSGPMLIPGTNLLTGGAKEGVLYVLNSNNLGQYNSNDSQIVQELNITNGGEIHGGPVYWQRSGANGGPLLYDWAATDTLRAYAFNGSTLAANPSTQGSNTPPWPGGILTLSANGDQPGSGVLWAAIVSSGDDEDTPPNPGELHAFDAANVSTELWNSTMDASRDQLGYFAKFVPPLVANGKVYMATWSNQVVVYGLLLSYTTAPTSLAFGNQQTNVASAPMTVTLTNTGSASLPITSITLSTPSPNPFSQTNTCGNAIAVGAHCRVSVVFDPVTVGTVNATLTINAGAAGTQTVALSGTGVAPTYSVSPGALAFGSQTTDVASAPMSVTLTNTGSVSLPITSITLSTPSPSPFSQTNTCGSTLAVGASCTVSVVFDPAAAGSANSTLAINVAGGATRQTVALSGTGVAPTYSVAPGSLAFGNQTVNLASTPMSVTLTNTGSASVPITSITLPTPSPFSQSNTCGSAIAVGGSCTINVVFTPTAAGSATATLSINGGGGAATMTVALSGTGVGSGVGPTYTVLPSALAFGNQQTNLASAPLKLTLTNSGTVSVPVTSITLSSQSSSAFSQTNNCAGAIAVGASCAISVVFDPPAVGLATAMLSINAGGRTATVGLSGTGTSGSSSPAPTVTLSATPASISLGQTVTLTWASQNATTCVSSGGQTGDGWANDQSTSGTVAITPTAAGTITYTITCSAGSQSAQAVAQVTAASPPASKGGGGALDTISLMGLLAMIALRERGRQRARRHVQRTSARRRR